MPDVLPQVHKEEGSYDDAFERRTTSIRPRIDNETLLQDVHVVTEKSVAVEEKESEHRFHSAHNRSLFTQVVQDSKVPTQMAAVEISLVNQPNHAKFEHDAPRDLMEQKKRLQLLIAGWANQSVNITRLSRAAELDGAAPFGTFDCSFSECYCIRGRYCHWCEGEQMMIPAQLGKLPNLLSDKKVCPTRITRSSACLVMGCVSDYDDSYAKMIVTYTWPLCTAIILSILMLLWTTYGGPWNRNDPKVVTFLSFPRTFDDFAKHGFEGASNVGPIPLQTVFDSSVAEHHLPSFVFSTFLGSGTAVAKATPHFWATIIVQCLCFLLLKISALILPWNDYRRIGQPFYAIAELEKTLSMVLPVIMGFYLVNRLQHYWAIRNAGIGVIGKANNLAMTAGAIFKDSKLDAGTIMKHKFSLYRLLMVDMFLTFSVVFSNLKNVTRADLIKAGLLTQKESDFLDTSLVGAPAAHAMITEKWIADWIVNNVPESQAHWGKKKMMEDALNLRTASVQLIMGYQERSVYSFEALLFSIIRILCMCMAVCIDQGIVDPDKRADILERYMFFRALAKGILVLFYASVLQMLNKLNNPFKTQKHDDDGLDFEALLFSTEKKLRDYLVGPQWPDPGSS
eukprot:gnl/MRDRNA2_/MRDRNA2_59656_c0_seq2.p1 gnl/MRDRNA2_/MRDRNA2_59656_c0~~gnl/MRDRNA2_/MRDRNA2_59656_c0_seq2.p1  ORF type:complete len:686 (+),score=81.00 gnl/MRDRNA2_/MRDRNA2_59656_c0_seq2:188-2059(+)